MEILKGSQFFSQSLPASGTFLMLRARFMFTHGRKVKQSCLCEQLSFFMDKKKNLLGGMCKNPVRHRYWVTAEKSSKSFHTSAVGGENKLTVRNEGEWIEVWYWLGMSKWSSTLLICPFWSIQKLVKAGKWKKRSWRPFFRPLLNFER